jgi:hypothetical protein
LEPSWHAAAAEPEEEPKSKQRVWQSASETPPPGLSRNTDILAYLDSFEASHLRPYACAAEYPCHQEGIYGTHEFVPLRKQGRFCWDLLANKAEPHVRRGTGRDPVEELKGGEREVWKKWDWKLTKIKPGAEVSFEKVTRDVLSWMWWRPSLKDKFSSMRVLTNLEEFGITMDKQLPGWWLHFSVEGRPQPHKVTLPETQRFGYHGTSMYCISRIFHNDSLHTGMASLVLDGQSLYGIYYHSAERAHLCQQTYMHYVGFGGGWYVAPLVVLDTVCQCVDSAGNPMKSVARRAKKSQTQYVTYEGQHRLDGLLLHVVHAAQVFRMPAACALYAEPSWLPRLELCPQDSWEEIMDRSRDHKTVPAGY